MTSAKALWTSKSTFISMTLNSLPIKDKSPFHTRGSICQCHHTKERGNLFMLNMPPISTFGCPFEHCFLIKRGSLSSSLFLNRHVSLIPLYPAWNSHDNISFNYSFLWIPSSRHSTLLSSSSHPVPAKRKSDTWACIEIALIFTHHTLAGAMAFICKLGEHTLPEKLWGGGGWWGRGGSVMSGTGRNAAGRSWPDSLHPIPRLLPSSHWQAVDWGLRLAATFSQKAREIQYWEWMATSCCQCCNLGNRQSTILVPPLATGMVGKMKWIFY